MYIARMTVDSTGGKFEDSIELLRRAKSGDDSALASALDRYRTRLLDRIRMMLGAEARRIADSGDVLQSALLEVLVRFDDFELRDEKRFLRWMTTIARNRIRGKVSRRREMSFEALARSTAGVLDEPGSENSPLEAAVRNEELLLLTEALENLSEDQRTAIELRSLEGLAFAEIGARLGIAENAARMRFHRALTELGCVLERELD